MKSNAVIPQTQTAISGSVGVPFSDGLEPALEIWSLNDVARKRRDRHISGRLSETQLISCFRGNGERRDLDIIEGAVEIGLSLFRLTKSELAR